MSENKGFQQGLVFPQSQQFSTEWHKELAINTAAGNYDSAQMTFQTNITNISHQIMSINLKEVKNRTKKYFESCKVHNESLNIQPFSNMCIKSLSMLFLLSVLQNVPVPKAWTKGMWIEALS